MCPFCNPKSMSCALKQEPEFVDFLQDDETALHCAASRGHVECLQSLLDAGAPVDAADQVCNFLVLL
ncbi:unnamed protein product [Gongylonema pulchrum]|uniref:ANK_REP_REGION domain-containing protein n=1 Tax=Gongylonema pulchrum TaxID=637853 RepID=A0A183EIY6_9BILA|nr:unnamed protein product [Gongylonema pulchrum]